MMLLNAFSDIPFFRFVLSFWQRQLVPKGHVVAKVPESFKKRRVPFPEPPCQMDKRSLRRLAYKVYFEIKDDHSELWNDGRIIATSMKSPHCGLRAPIGSTFFLTSSLNSIHKTVVFRVWLDTCCVPLL